MTRRLQSICLCLLPFIIILQFALAGAKPVQPSIVGPDVLTDQQVGKYVITNPKAEKLDIFSSSGIWVRGITVDDGVKCDLKDGGTLHTIICNGSFKVMVSSDYGQQLKFVMGNITKLVGAAGTLPEPDESDVHIYNSYEPTPASLSVAALPQQPTIVTNVLEGGYTEYLLAALNFTSDVTRTFDIALTAPPAGQLTKIPRSCVETSTPGAYSCRFVVPPQSWRDEGFEVHWLRRGLYVIAARGLVNGQDAGRNERTGNVIIVEHYGPRLYLPLARR
jgi:hypothetical protein